LLLNSLSKLHAFYQYSLNSFVVRVRWRRGSEGGLRAGESGSACSGATARLCGPVLLIPVGLALPTHNLQDVFERGIDSAPGGRRKPAPLAANRRESLMESLHHHRQTAAAGNYDDVMDAARCSTVNGHAGVRSSHAGEHHGPSGLGDHAPSRSSGGGSHRPSVFGDATLASAHSRLTAMGGPWLSTSHGGHHAPHGHHHHAHLSMLGGHHEEEEPPAELSPEQLEVRLAALQDTTTFVVFAYAMRGLFDRWGAGAGWREGRGKREMGAASHAAARVRSGPHLPSIALTALLPPLLALPSRAGTS
jgi:hypothetical protein